MAIPTNTVQSGAEAIREVAGLFRGLTDLLREWIAGADIRRAKAAVREAETFIRAARPLLDKYVPHKNERDPLSILASTEVKFWKYNN